MNWRTRRLRRWLLRKGLYWTARLARKILTLIRYTLRLITG